MRVGRRTRPPDRDRGWGHLLVGRAHRAVPRRQAAMQHASGGSGFRVQVPLRALATAGRGSFGVPHAQGGTRRLEAEAALARVEPSFAQRLFSAPTASRSRLPLTKTQERRPLRPTLLLGSRRACAAPQPSVTCKGNRASSPARASPWRTRSFPGPSPRRPRRGTSRSLARSCTGSPSSNPRSPWPPPHGD